MLSRNNISRNSGAVLKGYFQFYGSFQSKMEALEQVR